MQAPNEPAGDLAGDDTLWYVLVDQQQIGPVRLRDLVVLAKREQLRQTDLVWTAGQDSWIPAGSVPDLFSPLPPQSPLPPEQTAAPIDVGKDDRVQADDAAEERNQLQNAPAATAAASGSTSGNYFVRHWRGQLSLPVSYWINGVLLNVVAAIVIVAIMTSSRFKNDFNPGVVLASMILIWSTIFIVALWQLVGTWRSATRYSRAYPGRYWGGVAKFFIVLGAIRTIIEFGQGGIPQLAEFYNIYAGDLAIGKYSFRVLRDGQELEFSGGITFGAANELDRFLNAMGALKIVHLNSEGGRILAAQKMGELIKKRGLSTYVSNACLSACTIVFLHGRERLISAEARIGFHQPDFPGLRELDRQMVIAEEVQRLRQLGVSDAFARKANQALPSSMWYPSAAELIAEKVATRIISSAELALSGISPSQLSPERIEKTLLEHPIYASLRRTNPDVYARVYEKFESGLRRGSSFAELRGEIFPMTLAAFEEALPHTSQSLLLEFAKFLSTTATTLNRDNPSNCYFYFNSEKASAGMVLELRKTYKSISSAEDDLMARILDSYSGKVRLPSEKDISGSLEKVQAAMAARFGDDLSVFDGGDLPPSKHSTFCTILAAMYEDVLKMPPGDATALLRHLFSNK